MSEVYAMRVIARARNAYTDNFSVPRQPGLIPEVVTRIEFEEAYRVPEALRGLEGFSHLWLLWCFDRKEQAGWHPTVRPPRLGGNTRVGVFASRAPVRPNPIGLSVVRLLSVEPGPALLVRGADLADGTPIFDIKPYLPYADCVPEATGGFTEGLDEKRLEVDCDPDLLAPLGAEAGALLAVLSHDPRPGYQRDENRVYGFRFAGCEVRFRVAGSRLTVLEIRRPGAPSPV